MLSAYPTPFLDVRSCSSLPLASQHMFGPRTRTQDPSLVQRLVVGLIRGWIVTHQMQADLAQAQFCPMIRLSVMYRLVDVIP
jgi:hypothetical protein